MNRTLDPRGLRVSRRAAPLVAVALLAVACDSRPRGTETAQSSVIAESEPSSWHGWYGVPLRSVELHDGGLGEHGAVLDHQYLTLDAASGTFEWRTADMVLRGTFRQEGDRLLAHGDRFAGEAVIDASRGVLLWSGIAFERP